MEQDLNKEKNENKKTKKKQKNGPLYYITLILLIGIFVGCGVYLIMYFLESKHSEDKVDDLKEMISKDASDEMDDFQPNKEEVESTLPSLTYVDVNGVKVQEKFVDLYKKNNDFLGWISLEDTNIDYPVMQSLYDEEYYLHRDFEKEYSSAGTVFVDTACDVKRPDDNLLIYGHNMKTGKMFHDLLSYEKEDFYKNHKYIQFDTIYENATYEVIAAFRTKILAEEEVGFRYYQYVGKNNKQQFEEYITNCKALTPYNISTTAEYGDELITLSTCAYHDKNGRYVVIAKKILTRR